MASAAAAELQYECADCGQRFARANSLRVHRRRAHGQRRRRFSSSESESPEPAPAEAAVDDPGAERMGRDAYWCVVCDARFSRGASLVKHMGVHVRDGPPFSCRDCGLELPLVGELRRHRRTHGHEPVYECGACGAVFLTAYLLAGHEQRHRDKEARFQCDHCGREYTRNGLRVHLQAVACAAVLCRECGASFPRLAELKRHRRLAHLPAGPPFRCSLCTRVFLTTSGLSRHKRLHWLQRDPHVCADCEARFERRSDLREHRLTHVERNRRYRCRECGKQFGQLGHLKRHLHFHRPETRCTTCSRSFVSTAALEAHSRLHQDVFACPTCDFIAGDERALAAHQSEHEPAERVEGEPQGEDSMRKALDEHLKSLDRLVGAWETPAKDQDKPPGSSENPVEVLDDSPVRERKRTRFSCGSCGEVFSDLEARVRHLTSTPFWCSECGARFVHVGSLVVHVRSHVLAEPYECPDCEATFATREALGAHSAERHLEEGHFLCVCCQRGFDDMLDLRQHLSLAARGGACQPQHA